MESESIQALARKHFDGLAAKGNWAEMLYHVENRWGDWNSFSREEQFKYVKAVVSVMVDDSRARRGFSLFGLLWTDQVQIFFTIAKPIRRLLLAIKRFF